MSIKDNNFNGLYWLIFNEVFLIAHIILIKTLVGEFSVFQIVFMRSISSSIIIIPILFYLKNQNNVFVQFQANLTRVVLSFMAISIQFFTISNIQLAQVSTIGYLRPSIMSIFAYFILSEKQSKGRWLVLIVGFLSILLVFSPESNSIQLIALLALLGSCCGSLSTIFQKFLSKKFSEIQLMVWYSVGISILSLPFCLYTWKELSLNELIFMVLTGLLATGAQYFYIKAFRLSQASFLAPIQYFHIIPVLVIGYLIFSEIPSYQTLLGALIIIISLIGLLIWEKNR
ncbi:MAG: DMT family transporter [Candidatus Puniceispirillales bacterium]